MDIVSVGSSSSGNSYIITAGGCTIILDAGLSAKRIKAALEELGRDPADVDAVLVTHEHIDHVRSVRAISRCCVRARFYTSRGTAESAESFRHVPEERLQLMSAGETAALGSEDEICIRAFPLSHDAAEPLGFTVEADGDKLAVITDSGVITEGIFEAVRDADQIVLESNHDVDMLMFGEYPYPVKVRIKGDSGHLSNESAGDVLSRILAYRRSIIESKSPVPSETLPLRVMLAHLSFHNNYPLFARQTVEEKLDGSGYVKGRDYVLDVASKEELTFMPGLE